MVYSLLITARRQRPKVGLPNCVAGGGIASLEAGTPSTRSSPKVEHFWVRRGRRQIANVALLGNPAFQHLSVPVFWSHKILSSLSENNHEHNMVSCSFEEVALVDCFDVALNPLGSGSGNPASYGRSAFWYFLGQHRV